MTSLSLALQAIQRAGPSGTPLEPGVTRELARRAHRQAERLNKLIEDLLTVSQIDTGRLPLSLGEVEIGHLVREVIAYFELDLERSRCRVSLQSDAAVVGWWDRSRLDQVITNLLSNAIKFGAGKPIEIVVDDDGGVARLRVTDHGIGIDPAHQQRIFERFGRAVSARHYGGLGLGLYISRRIVEAHGGAIRVESQPGDGTAFIVELPRSGPRVSSGGSGDRSPPDSDGK